MAEWLSEAWLGEVAAQAGARPPVSGANGTVSLAITTGKRDEVSYHWSYRNGVPGDGAVGAAADADLVLTIARDDAQAVASGEMEPSVAFMRGRLKASGDGALLLGLLASTATDTYRDWRRRVMGDD
jgi:putative sterol carrier protein